jgi:hypothetical protein
VGVRQRIKGFFIFTNKYRGVQHGVSKGVEDGRRLPALHVATRETAVRLLQGMPPAGQGRAWQAHRYFRESMPTPCHTPMNKYVPEHALLSKMRLEKRL